MSTNNTSRLVDAKLVSQAIFETLDITGQTSFRIFHYFSSLHGHNFFNVTKTKMQHVAAIAG